METTCWGWSRGSFSNSGDAAAPPGSAVIRTGTPKRDDRRVIDGRAVSVCKASFQRDGMERGSMPEDLNGHPSITPHS